VSEEIDRRKPRYSLVRIAKWLIALIVAAGLVLAIRSAIEQWNAESQKLRQRISELSDQIEAETDQTTRGELLQQRQNLRGSIPTLANLHWRRILLACLLYGIGLVPPGFVLAAAAGSLGQRPTMSTAMAAQLLGHAGKYVPGKAMVIVLRAGGLSIDGVTIVTATISVFMETLLMMAVGAAVAGVVICWLPVPTWMMGTAAFVAVAASVPTLPPILKRVAARIAHRNPDSNIPPNSSLRFFVVGWAWSLSSWFFIGASFTVLVSAIPSPLTLPAAAELFAVSTAAIALAMVVGFASLLPGGAGVRELVLTTLLAPAVGTAHALLAAIAARLMFIVVEGVCAGFSWLWLRKAARGNDHNQPSDYDKLDSAEISGDDAPAWQPE
jgi:uncharacterized membrane protein YbhN (UPF0104 family)